MQALSPRRAGRLRCDAALARWPRPAIRQTLSPISKSSPTRSASLRVLVLPPAAGLGGLCFRRSLEHEAEVGRDERGPRRDRVGGVDGPLLARGGDPAPVFPHPPPHLRPRLRRPCPSP